MGISKRFTFPIKKLLITVLKLLQMPFLSVPRTA